MGIPLVALQGQQAQIQSPFDKANHLAVLAGNQLLNQQRQQQIEAGQMQLEQQRQTLSDQKAIMDSYRANNGDWDKVLQDVQGKVSLPSYQGLVKSHTEMQQAVANLNDKQLANHQKTLDQLTAIHDTLTNTPDAQYGDAWRNAALRIHELDPSIQVDPNNPIPKEQLEAHGIGLETQKRLLDAEEGRRKAAQDEATLRETTAKATEAEQEAALTPQERARLKQALPEEERYVADYLAANKLPDTPENRNKGREKYRTLLPAYNFAIAGGPSGGLSPEALDQQAERYFQTGKLPPIGRGAAGLAVTRKIMQRASELHPGESLAAGSAEYQANEKSLGNLQKLYDSVSAFENTAIKNLDQVAKAGAKVPDLGTRFANTPVRMISAKVLGTPEMAAFRTALLTAQTEAARVLNSASATGVLSDQARKEAMDVLDGNLPFPAMMASINQLKTDFANRHQSYADQIEDIKGRIGGKKAPAAAPTGGIPTFSQWKTSRRP